MIGLLRYIFLKGWRERQIQTLLLAPSIMFVTPLLVIGIANLFRGREAWPLTLARDVSPAGAADILTFPALMFAAIIAATGAFWVFRAEMLGRSIGFFVLAQPRTATPLSAIISATVLATGSYVITITLLALVTESPVNFARSTAFIAFSGILLSAAAAAFFVGLSPELQMLNPTYAVAFTALFYMLEKRSAMIALAFVAVAMALALAASLTWRRRCAA